MSADGSVLAVAAPSTVLFYSLTAATLGTPGAEPDWALGLDSYDPDGRVRQIAWRKAGEGEGSAVSDFLVVTGGGHLLLGRYGSGRAASVAQGVLSADWCPGDGRGAELAYSTGRELVVAGVGEPGEVRHVARLPLELPDGGCRARTRDGVR